MKRKLSVIRQTLRIIYEDEPRTFLSLVALALTEAFGIVIQLLSLEYFINNCIKYSSDLNKVLLSAVILLFLLVVRKIFNAFFNYRLNTFIKKTQGIFENYYLKNASQLSLKYLYNHPFEVLKSQAKLGASHASVFSLISLMLLFFNIPYFIFLTILFSVSNPFLLLIILLIFFPTFFSIKKNVEVMNRNEIKIANTRRKMDYLASCLSEKKYRKESQIVNCKKKFLELYMIEHETFMNETKYSQKIVLKNSLILEFVKLLSYLAILGILIYLSVNKMITIGFLIAITTSLNNMFSVMNDTVNRDIKNVSQFYPEIEKMIDFFEDETKMIPTPSKYENKLFLKNISYSYPEQEKKVLKNISIDLSSNETIALVGENGSGKTTLSKIILGLLQPTAGEIIGNTTLGRLENASALFQNLISYPLSVKENICISDFNQERTDEELKAFCTFCGIDIMNKKIFPEGLSTILSRDFGGTELSGGQLQRISLARCINKEAAVLILDEPTSAIDPIEESKLYERFRSISKDKLSIIVTHRLGLVSIADRIIVLNEGSIIEEGTHEELMKRKGKYHEMYTTQSVQYQTLKNQA